MLRRFWFALTISILSASGVARADFVATSFSLPQTPFGGRLINGVDGFEFTPTANLLVTALGFYDHNGDGLLHDHPVGIYSFATQALVAPSVVVTNSSVLDAATNFRYESVTPFILAAGTTYVLAGLGVGPVFDPYVQNPAGGVTFGPDLGFVRYRTSSQLGTSSLIFPTDSGRVGDASVLFFGPTFRYTITAAVPEPSAMLSLGLGLACAGTYVVRSRNRRS